MPRGELQATEFSKTLGPYVKSLPASSSLLNPVAIRCLL